jgi:magnesium transporter
MRIFILREHELAEAQTAELPTLLENGTPIWVDILRPDPDDIKALSDVFRFHPLAIEDTVNMRQRPKVEDYGDTLFTIINPVHFDGEDVEFTELDAFLSPNSIVTVHNGLEDVIEHVALTCTRRMAFGERLYPALILYLLVDVTVDGYFPVIDAISDELDTLADHLVLDPAPVNLQRVFEIRKTLMEFMRVVGQQRDMFTLVLRDHQPFVTDLSLRYYMRDVFDHVLRLHDQISMTRDEAASAVELYFSSQSNKLNVTIQKLTIITIGIGILTVIGGFYGMNFLQTLPPFTSEWGVPFVLMLMLTVAAGTFLAVRRIGPRGE